MVMDAVVSPVFQVNEVPPPAVKVALSPRQIAISSGKMKASGREFTDTLRLAMSLQPLLFETITEKLVVISG